VIVLAGSDGLAAGAWARATTGASAAVVASVAAAPTNVRRVITLSVPMVVLLDRAEVAAARAAAVPRNRIRGVWRVRQE
jgi:hypothetical protein